MRDTGEEERKESEKIKEDRRIIIVEEDKHLHPPSSLKRKVNLSSLNNSTHVLLHIRTRTNQCLQVAIVSFKLTKTLTHALIFATQEKKSRQCTQQADKSTRRDRSFTHKHLIYTVIAPQLCPVPISTYFGLQLGLGYNLNGTRSISTSPIQTKVT